MKRNKLLVLDVLAEESKATLTATASHLCPDDCRLTYEIDWGDGSPVEKGSAICGVPFSAMHIYSGESARTVAMRMWDQYGEGESFVCQPMVHEERKQQ